ncbi:MAG TPA: hypothetical protein VEW05_28705 [Candidatus Polarisedimenticolia bacterium]|nr:hypothetical protein [Candidatus Polarisedimenticolia bacterium]
MKCSKKANRKAIVAILAMLLLNGAAQAQDKITIPAGTQIPARLASQLDSGQVHVGDAVTMDVIEDVKINGLILIPRGAIVMGHVTEAKGARKMGRGGKLDVQFSTVTAGDGTKVPVTGGANEKGHGGYGGGSLAAAGAAGLFFPPAGALLLLKHGHASVISVGTVLSVSVAADTAVLGTPAPIQAAAPVAPAPAAPVEPTMQVQSIPTQPSVAEAARQNRAQKEKPQQP